MSISMYLLLATRSGRGRTGKFCQRVKVKVVDDRSGIGYSILYVLAAPCRLAAFTYIE